MQKLGEKRRRKTFPPRILRWGVALLGIGGKLSCSSMADWPIRVTYASPWIPWKWICTNVSQSITVLYCTCTRVLYCNRIFPFPCVRMFVYLLVLEHASRKLRSSSSEKLQFLLCLRHGLTFVTSVLVTGQFPRRLNATGKHLFCGTHDVRSSFSVLLLPVLHACARPFCSWATLLYLEWLISGISTSTCTSTVSVVCTIHSHETRSLRGRFCAFAVPTDQ
jgi:hypothetical protein